MDDKMVMALIEKQQGQLMGQAIQLHDLRGRVASNEAYRNEAVVAQAEAEAPLKALDEFTDYLIERTRVEREAQGENWITRTAITPQTATLNVLLADLCTKLDQIRRSYGL